MPFEELDLRLFLDKIPWKKVKNNLKDYFLKFEKLLDQKRDIKHSMSGISFDRINSSGLGNDLYESQFLND
jgi:hypothetical protein